MTVDIATLLSWEPARLAQVSEAVLRHRRGLVGLQDEMSVADPPASWRGDDGTAARVQHRRLFDRLSDQIAGFSLVIEALDEAVTALVGARRDLEATLSEARARGLQVDVGTGRVSSSGGEGADMIGQAVVLAYAATIQAALQRAADADAALAGALRHAGSGEVEGAATLAGSTKVPPRLPPPERPRVLKVQTGVISLGAGAGFSYGTKQLVRLEHLSDGTVRITRLVGRAVGFGVGLGSDTTFTSDDRKYGLSSSVGADASAGYSGGNVYVIDESELENFLATDELVRANQGVALAVPAVGWLGLDEKANDLLERQRGVPEPEGKVRQVELGGKTSGGYTWLFAGGSAGVAEQGAVSVTDRADGSQVLDFAVRHEAQGRLWAGAEDSLATASAEGEVGTRISVERGPDGDARTVTVHATAGGQYDAHGTGEQAETTGDDEKGNHYREITMTLPVDTHEQRLAVHDLVQGDASAFDRAVREGGSLTRRDFEVDSDSTGANGAVKLGPTLSLEGMKSMRTEIDRGAAYWDGREWVPWE